MVSNNAVKTNSVAEAVSTFLEALGDRLGTRFEGENFKDTPQRVARMYDEILGGHIDTEEQVTKILSSAFPCTNNSLVLVRDIETFSLCPHHLLPVRYKVHVAYIPGKKVLGLSKLARLADVLSRRLVLQEQLTEDVTENLMRVNGCQGAACVVEGTHYCMVMRGVKQSQATTITSSLKGAFLQESTRAELFDAIYGQGRRAL